MKSLPGSGPEYTISNLIAFLLLEVESPNPDMLAKLTAKLTEVVNASGYASAWTMDNVGLVERIEAALRG